ncbi:MAG: transporter [Burkholderiaceae bacterium]|nr:MAG: transporter [Burkholderiaceae bacterium]
MLKHLVIVAALSASVLLPAGARAQDLLSIWHAAAEHDLQLDVARADHGASETLRDQAAALGRPQVGITLGAGLGADDVTMRGARFSAPGMGQFDGARFATSVNGGLATRLGIVARQPLIDAARDAQQAELRLSADMGDTAWRDARTALMMTTAERYFALAVAEERVRVMQQQVDAFKQAQAEAHERYRIGAAPVTDTHEADAALASAEAQLAAAQLQSGTSRRVLADSTGLARPHAALPATEPAEVQNWPYWEQAVQADNPRLRLLTQAIAVSEQKLHEQSVAGRPVVDLVARASQDRLAGGGDFGSAANRHIDGMVGVQITIPLGIDGMPEAREREAVMHLEKARAELDLARQQVGQQAYAAWDGLQAGTAQVKALAQGLKANAARLDATRLGHEVGDRTTLDVLNAENAYTEAQLALAQARSDQVLTRLRLAALADQLNEGVLGQVNATLERRSQQ